MSRRVFVFIIGAFMSNLFIAFATAVLGLWPAVLLATTVDVTLFIVLLRR